MLENCVLIILKLNWNHLGLGHKKTKINICDHMLTSSTQLQNRSFHVVERTRTSSKCQKIEYARAKRAKILFFIVKYANLWGFLLPSSSWLLKLPIIILCTLLIHLTRCDFTQMAGYFRFETPWHFWAIMKYLTRQVCQLIFWERLKDMNSLAPRRGRRGDEHRRIHGIKPLSVFLRVETG